MIVMNKVIKIEGMSCEHCVGAVKKALTSVDGVSSVEVSLEGNCADVGAAETVTDAMLRAAVEDAGYDVVGISD